MVARPTPRDITAVTSGSAMPSNEPKTRKSTTAAARMPSPRLPTLGRLAASMAWPPSSTCTPFPAAARAVVTTCLVAATGRTFACWSKVIVAKATCPLGATCPAPAGLNGETTEDTWGSVAILASIGSIRARTAGIGDLAGVGGDDDLVAVTGLAGRRGLQQFERVRALRSGQREAVGVRRADASAEPGQPDQRDQPEDQDDEAMVVAPPG